MSWRKNGLLSALLLLVVALIGAVIWQRSEDSMVRESSFQSSSMRKMYRYSKMTPNYGPEFAYRVNEYVPPGFSAESRELIGYLPRTQSAGMQALKVYGYSKNSNIRKWGERTSLYSLYGQTIGFCRKSKADGWVVFVELSKLDPSETYPQYAYVTSIETASVLKWWGYDEANQLGYIKAPATPPGKPFSKPAEAGQPQSLVNLASYSRSVHSLGTEYTYRTVGTSVAGYSNRKVMGYLYTQPGPGLKALQVWSRASAWERFSFGEKQSNSYYFVATAGYCRIEYSEGYTPLHQVHKVGSYTGPYFALAYDSYSRYTLYQEGYHTHELLCYIKISE